MSTSDMGRLGSKPILPVNVNESECQYSLGAGMSFEPGSMGFETERFMLVADGAGAAGGSSVAVSDASAPGCEEGRSV